MPSAEEAIGHEGEYADRGYEQSGEYDEWETATVFCPYPVRVLPTS